MTGSQQHAGVRLCSFSAIVTALAVWMMPAPARASIIDFDAGPAAFSVQTPLAFDGPWTYGASAGVGGSGGWFSNGQGPDTGHANTSNLISPVFVATSAAVSLTFDHRYSFEYFNFDGTAWDGGALLLSVNGGAFTEVPLAFFTANGYNGTVQNTFTAPIDSVLHGQQAFVSTSTGYDTSSFLASFVNLGGFASTLGSFGAGDTFQLEFMAAYDSNSFREQPAWVIDNVNVSDGEVRATGDVSATGAAPSPVPEPATISLMLGPALLLVSRYRQRLSRR